MATLSSAKMLGGIGSILTLLSAAPYYSGTVLNIVGLVMILFAVKYISEITGDRKIYSNIMIGVVLGIVGAVVFAAAVAFALLRFIGLGMFTGNPAVNPPIANMAPGDILALIGVLALGLFVVWILAIVSAVFLRRGLTSIAARTGVGLFGTAGLLYLIGAALAIVLVGFILIFIAEILLVVAFFSLPDQLPMQPMAPAAPSAPAPMNP